MHHEPARDLGTLSLLNCDGNHTDYNDVTLRCWGINEGEYEDTGIIWRGYVGLDRPIDLSAILICGKWLLLFTTKQRSNDEPHVEMVKRVLKYIVDVAAGQCVTLDLHPDWHRATNVYYQQVGHGRQWVISNWDF